MRAEPGVERASLRLGRAPAMYRLAKDAQVPLERTAPAAPEPSGFLGKPERRELEQLASGAVTSAKKASGRRTLAFELALDSGVSAVFEPEQRVSRANWYAQIAAYYLDRALGLGRVPPVVARKLAWPQLQAAAGQDARQRKVVVGSDGQVRGALVLSLKDELVPALTPAGWESWIRGEPARPNEVSPYQREHEPRGREVRYQQPPEPQPSELPAELSDMILFDFLTLNDDRFGAGNANILTLGKAGPLVFVNNGAAFSPGPARRARLLPLAKFRKRTVDALRAFDVRAFGTKLAADPLGPFLDESMLRGIGERRDAVLQHIAEQERRYGAGVYAW